MKKMTVKDIIKNDYLTIAQIKTIPTLINAWLTVDEGDTLEHLIEQQTVMFVSTFDGTYGAEVIKIEKLEWAGNYNGRKNDYDSDITVWVTAIVDLGNNKIVRLSYDLFDSMIMTSESGCSGLIY